LIDFNNMQGLLHAGETHPNIAYLYALIGNTGIAVQQILFKYAMRTFTSFQIIVIRSVLLIMVNLVVLRSVGQSPYMAGPSGTSLLTQLSGSSSPASVWWEHRPPSCTTASGTFQ
jgi:hypothetical protein